MRTLCAVAALAAAQATTVQQDAFDAAAQAQSLTDAVGALRWSYRLLVVDETVLSAQLGRLDPDNMIERDVMLIAFGPEAATAARFAADGQSLEAFPIANPALSPAYRRALTRGGETMRVLLIGKDGGVKAAWPKPPSQADLNAIIDAMPMRAEEMRRGG